MENIIVSKNIDSVPGIYALWNVDNSKIYIGSSKNIKNRIKNHLSLLSTNKHTIKALQDDFNKGNQFIVFLVLKVDNRDNLRYFEDKAAVHFGAYKYGYNSQYIMAHEPREVTNIRKQASALDYYYNGADKDEQDNIINKILDN